MWGGGSVGINYRGTRSTNPCNVTYAQIDPTQFTVAGYSIGDLLANTQNDTIWALVGRSSVNGQQVATWSQLNVEQPIPLTIALGGTNATTMATIDGTVYYDGTRLVTTATGTSGQVLTSNGAGLAPTYQSFGGALVLIQTRTATAQATLTFTTGITNSYNNYLLLGNSITSASATIDSKMFIQLSNNGGGAYDATNYFAQEGAGQSGITVGLSPNGSDWTGAFLSASVDLLNLTSANASHIVGQSTFWATVPGVAGSSAGNLFSQYAFTGFPTNAFRLIMSDGSNFSGNFSLYAYVK